jgi:hypothetical protein
VEIMTAEKNKDTARHFSEATRVGWMYHWWVAMGGHGDDFPGEVLQTLTEPQKFQLIAESRRARAQDPGQE